MVDDELSIFRSVGGINGHRDSAGAQDRHVELAPVERGGRDEVHFVAFFEAGVNEAAGEALHGFKVFGESYFFPFAIFFVAEPNAVAVGFHPAGVSFGDGLRLRDEIFHRKIVA